MISIDELGPRIYFLLGNGKYHLSECSIYVFIVAVCVAVLGIWLGSNLQKVPKGKQVLAELLVGFIYDFSEEHLGERYTKIFAPYIGSLLTYLLFANSLGLIGLRPATADINITAGLGLLSFLIIQVSAILYLGPRERAAELGDPYYFILPMNLISECVLPFTLALRLFGNIFGGMVVIELWMELMEYLSNLIWAGGLPFLRCVTVIPLNMFFDIFEPIIQAYIFTTLTAVNLGESLSGQSQATAERRRNKKLAKRGELAEKAA